MKRRDALALLAAALLPGCVDPAGSGASASPASGAASVDPTAASPARIVVAGGALAEIVFALGAGDSVVGVDTSCTFPAAVQRLPQVGYQRKLSAEGVLSLRPSVLLAGNEAGPPEALAQIEGAGVRIVRFAEVQAVDAAVARIRAAGVAIGRVEAAATLADQVSRDIASERAAIGRLRERPRALFIYARGPGTALVGGRNTGAAAMIDLAGGSNAAEALDGFKAITAEAVIAARPDVIVIPEKGLESLGGVAGLLALPGLAATPAAAGKRVAAIDDGLLLGFGPRLAEALRKLAGALHGAPIDTK